MIALLSRIAARLEEREARLRAEHVARVLAGECVCRGGGWSSSPDCPRMPEHLAQMRGHETWECRECGRPAMFAPGRVPAVCPACGSTSGWNPSTTTAMMESTRRQLEDLYARPA